MKAFKTPAKWLADVDADAAGMLIAAAADIALIIDRKGIIRDVAFQSTGFANEFEQSDTWIGRSWAETVTVESRPKIADMLRDMAGKSDYRPNTLGRHVNYPAREGIDVPILFSTIPVGRSGRAIAFGRDLRALASLQQRLIDVQQSLERDYSRLRHVETRYRILFQMSTEPVLVLDGQTQKIIEANPAAQKLFGDRDKLSGIAFAGLVETGSQDAIAQLLASIRSAGRMDDVRIHLTGHEGEMRISAFLLRQGEGQNFLLRLSPISPVDPNNLLSDSKAKLLKLIESAPDGFVVTGNDGRLLAANAAFLDMTQLSSEEQAHGQSLDRWLGRPGVDLNVLSANLRQHGSVRLYPTVLRDEFGTQTEVEISAVTVMNGGKPCFGFAIRNIGRRTSPEFIPPATTTRAVPRSLEQISELIGRVSLKEIVREATEVIERLSIEAALKITGDNRASAAEMLGLSRQSLYVKLRRYGMMDAEALGVA
jgi:transcriptional regulator PpsR